MISETKRSGCIPQLTLVMGIVICIFACNNSKTQPAEKSVSKLDSCQVVYKDSSVGPFIFVGLYRTTPAFVPVGDSFVTTTGKWVYDTVWAMKQQTDTFKSPTAVHTYNYIPVSKKFVTIIPKSK